MAFVIPERLQKLYDHLRLNFYPEANDILFFDLSTDGYNPQRLTDEKEITPRMYAAFDASKPFAVICRQHNGDPVMGFDGISYMIEINLDTQRVISYHERNLEPIDEEELKKQIRELKEYLSSYRG